MLTFFKAYGGWIALTAAFGLAFGLYRSEIAAAEARGQAEEMAAQAEANWTALLDSVDTWEERKATWDSTHAALSSQLEDQKGATRVAREGALQVVSAARARIRTLADSLTTLTAEDLEVIATSIDSLETAGTMCDVALGTCEQLVEAADARIFAIEAETRQALETSRQQALVIDRFQSLRRPKVGTVGLLGWAAAAVATVLLVVR